MIKTAIFLEGQTELIFTRELILKFFEWQGIWVECYSLFNDQDRNRVDYSYKDPNATCFFEILNIGNDNKVLSSILKRENYLLNQGFDKIIGLRDMYSKDYREVVQNATIDLAINQKFIAAHQQTIDQKAEEPDRINFHFAIMELEAWLLGIEDLFQRHNHTLDCKKIETECQVNLSQIDPEATIFHPSTLINSIMEIVGDGYDKKKGEVNKFMGHIAKQDFINLLEREKCESFNHFCSSLGIEA
jgi:hypothetical protein